MAATRGPDHRPLELFDGRVWPPPQLLDGRCRARLLEVSHYCRPAQSSGAEAPCPEYACGPPAPRYPPGSPPALRSRPGGRREGPPGKEDYAPHNAPRQKPLTSGIGRAYSGCFPGHRDILFRKGLATRCDEEDVRDQVVPEGTESLYPWASGTHHRDLRMIIGSLL